MEVAPTQHRAILRENERIICDRAQLALKNAGTILQSIAHGPEDLRSTAQGVRILYSCAIAMATVYLAVAHQLKYRHATAHALGWCGATARATLEVVRRGVSMPIPWAKDGIFSSIRGHKKSG